MIDEGPPLSPDVRAVLDQERPIPTLPPAVRARAMAAARAAIAASPVPAATPAPTPWLQWAAAAALMAAAGAAVGAVMYHRHAVALPPVVEPARPAPSSIPAAPPVASAIDLPAAPAVLPAAPVTDDAKRMKVVVPQEELRLLRQARAAVAREDFAAALPPITEHARRFKDGRLTEEREALRVRALAGLGRTGEARRAAIAFEKRFPRSVLLPAVRRISPDAQ